jgi:hypothetical protein
MTTKDTVPVTLLRIALNAMQDINWAINELEREVDQELDGTLEALDILLLPSGTGLPAVDAQTLEQFLAMTRTKR